MNARIQNVLLEESDVCIFFYVDEWVGRGYKYHYKRVIIGPPAKRNLVGEPKSYRYIVQKLKIFAPES